MNTLSIKHPKIPIDPGYFFKTVNFAISPIVFNTLGRN